MTAGLALTDIEKAIVIEILHAHSPAETHVHVFGSRATGQCKPWSDLDLAIEAPAPLSLSTLASLAEAFDESSLPWKVDLVDRRTVNEEFGRLIDLAKIPLE